MNTTTKTLLTKLLTMFRNTNWRKVLFNYFLLTVGTGLGVISFQVFVVPTNIAPGGIMGLTLLVEEFTGWPVGLITIILQIPMLILGFYYLGRYRFLLSTWYVTMLYGFSLDLVAPLFPPEGITDDLLLNTLYGGIVGGMGLGLIFWGGGAFASTGIISRIIQLKTGLPTSQLYVMIDGVVIVFQGLVFGWDIALYALMMMFLWGVATDYVLEGPSVIRTAFIVTDKPEELSMALFERLGVGVTAMPAQGMFTKQERKTLFCTIYRSDVPLLQDVVSEIAPRAFLVIGQGHNARGGVLRRRSTPPAQKTPVEVDEATILSVITE